MSARLWSVSTARWARCCVLSLPRVSLPLLALWAGCASPPAPRLHSLLESGAATASATFAAPGWELLTVAVPAQVDRPQWLVRNADGSLVALEQERWVAPLAEELRAAIGTRLAAALALPPALPAAARWRITVDVTGFESQWGRAARLEADWSLQRAGEAVPALRCRSVLARPATSSITALAEAHRANAAQLGDTLAAALRRAAATSGATPGAAAAACLG